MHGVPEAISYHIGIPTIVFMNFVAMAILALLSFLATRRMSIVPGGIQNVFEVLFSFVFDLADSIIGAQSKKYYPLFIGLFLYILKSNLMGVIPGMVSPTSNINTTLALALIIFFSTHFFGIRKKGLLKYLDGLCHGVPIWLKPMMFVIEIISELARPVSLSFRLFGNMMAKELLLAILALLIIVFFQSHGMLQKALSVVPLVLQPLMLLFGLFVAFIQAFIFTVLSIFYIGGAVAEDH